MRVGICILFLLALATADYYVECENCVCIIFSSLGSLTTEEFVRLSSDEAFQPLLVAFVSPACENCERYYYPLVQALHAFRGTDVSFFACCYV